jgi:hypothetical protein
MQILFYIKRKSVHGGILTVTYDKPGGKVVGAKWSGYKEKSFVDKNFTSSPYHDKMEGNNDQPVSPEQGVLLGTATVGAGCM